MVVVVEVVEVVVVEVVRRSSFVVRRSSFVVLRSSFARTLQGYISANIYFSKLCAIIVICSSSKRKYLGVLGEHFKLLLNTCISCSVNIL